MSDQVRPARPARWLSAPHRAQPHAWQRYFWLWEVYFAAVAVATVAFTQWEGRAAHPWEPARPLAQALVGALVLWYVAAGRALVRDQALGWRRRLVYQAGVLALFAPAVLLNGAVEIALAALLPQAFMTWPLVPAVGAAAALYLAPLAALVARGGASSVDLPGFGARAAIVVALTAVVSVYINRIAGQSARRAELIDQLAASQAEVSRLSHEAGVAAERQRLAGDIHDTVAQGLSSVVMLIQAADAELEHDPARAHEHLALAERTARENLAETRALVAALTPAVLTGHSLPEAVRRLGTRAATRTLVEVCGQPRRLDTALEVVLLRAAQESLTNVDRHAGAATARVRLAYRPREVVLEVVDDGRGLPTRAGGDGFGLAAMRARVEQVGGEVRLDSTTGGGTAVRVSVPALAGATGAAS